MMVEVDRAESSSEWRSSVMVNVVFIIFQSTGTCEGSWDVVGVVILGRFLVLDDEVELRKFNYPSSYSSRPFGEIEQPVQRVLVAAYGKILLQKVRKQRLESPNNFETPMLRRWVGLHGGFDGAGKETYAILSVYRQDEFEKGKVITHSQWRLCPLCMGGCGREAPKQAVSISCRWTFKTTSNAHR